MDIKSVICFSAFLLEKLKAKYGDIGETISNDIARLTFEFCGEGNIEELEKQLEEVEKQLEKGDN